MPPSSGTTTTSHGQLVGCINANPCSRSASVGEDLDLCSWPESLQPLLWPGAPLTRPRCPLATPTPFCQVPTLWHFVLIITSQSAGPLAVTSHSCGALGGTSQSLLPDPTASTTSAPRMPPVPCPASDNPHLPFDSSEAQRELDNTQQRARPHRGLSHSDAQEKQRGPGGYTASVICAVSPDAPCVRARRSGALIPGHRPKIPRLHLVDTQAGRRH
jgi:hypothetical protein